MNGAAGTERAPRVLVVTRSYPNSVLPTLGLWIQRPTELLAQSCDVRVVSPIPYCPPLPSVGPLHHYARFRRVPAVAVHGAVTVYHPRFPSGPGRTLYGLEARAMYEGSRRLARELREDLPFDLVHAHFVYPEGAVARRLSEEYGVPFLITEHAPWTKQWFSRRRVREESLAAGRAAAALLPVSNSVARTMFGYEMDRARVRVIPVGVDVERFSLGAPGSRRVEQVLFVGQVNLNKGIDILLRAMALLADRDDPGQLTIVGGSYYRNGARQERRLRRLADSLRLGDRVRFAGPLPPDDVARLMRESALVVLPSRAESFGAVLVEALASGTPVVATRCGGPEDIVSEGDGVLVPPEDPTALADAISTVLREAGRFDARELRARATPRFSWHEVVAQTREEYVRAMAGSAAGRAARGFAAVGGGT